MHLQMHTICHVGEETDSLHKLQVNGSDTVEGIERRGLQGENRDNEDRDKRSSDVQTLIAGSVANLFI